MTVLPQMIGGITRTGRGYSAIIVFFYCQTTEIRVEEALLCVGIFVDKGLKYPKKTFFG